MKDRKNYFAKNIVVLSKKTSLDIIICSECNNRLFLFVGENFYSKIILPET